MNIESIRQEQNWKQDAWEHMILNYYRDNNVFSVYKCETCGFRGIGASVTLHPYEHGPMVREEIKTKET